MNTDKALAPDIMDRLNKILDEDPDALFKYVGKECPKIPLTQPEDAPVPFEIMFYIKMVADAKQWEAELTKRITALINERTEYKRLSEKLMGLLKKEAVINKIYAGTPSLFKRIESDWQSYCKEHNLKIDIDGK